MEFFKKYYSDVDFHNEEVSVCCPFHDDSVASAHVNTTKSLFHCKVCNVGYSEAQFLAELEGVTVASATNVLHKLSSNAEEWNVGAYAKFWSDDEFRAKVRDRLHLSDETLLELKLGVKESSAGLKLAVPVFYNGVLMDVRSYNILNLPKTPKVKSEKGAASGWVVPFDLWKDSEETTYIFEGEKDMLIAREQGLNAITLTGGAGAKPNEYVLNSFKDREVVICYDNDKAGVDGAKALNKHLIKQAKSVKYIDIGEVVENEKEDFFDYIVKYDGDIFEFLSLEEKEFEYQAEEVVTNSIKDMLEDSKLKKNVTTIVTISAEYAEPYAVPSTIRCTKLTEDGGKGNAMMTGEERHWYLDNRNVSDILHLMEVGANMRDIDNKAKWLAKVPSGEKYVKVEKSNLKTVFKVRVVDKGEETSNASLDLYTFDRLMVGKQYLIDYAVFPHPSKHQRLVAIATNTKSLDAKDDFQVVPSMLNQFKSEGTIEQRLDKLYQSAKHHIAKHLNFNIWLFSDLTANSVLQFHYSDQLLKGALDTFILGDTQVGKSETASKMSALYDFGKFLSLKTSSTVGLIGGSNKVEGTWLNTIGAIPRQHKGWVILEEFSGARQDFIKTMTDIRSSGKLRLARAAGEMEVDCMARMLTISNPINDVDGSPRHLSTFPNGVVPISELVTSAEDIARYDGFLLAPKPTGRINPYSLKLEGEPIPVEAYGHKALWVQTREPHHVEFEGDTASYIWEQAEYLNSKFECNFPLFGTTTSLKLARFSVALASLIVSTDEFNRKVVVTKDIVDYMVKFLEGIYSSDIFKLDVYKKEYDSYNVATTKDIKALQEIYSKNAVVLEFLEGQSSTSRNNLRTISGYEGTEFNPLFNKLVASKFVRLRKEQVYPTNKFRKCMARVDRNFTINTGALEAAANADIFKEGD